MAAFKQNQRFALLLLIALAGSSAAQTFTQEDRGSILKFMGVLINFLDLETDNATSTAAPNTNGTSVGTTTTLPSEPTGETTESSGTTSNSTTGDSTSGTTTTLPLNSAGSDTTTEVASTTVRRRICFKRVCYKFSADKGYIY
ncbi:uncharacterized protein LOC108150810 [Drosophila miranda]|uniref:uncharacterized protein LOC108150810 n=1 Tax=Drosophila miranda TaxID=7229 RepID=UPI0007E62CE5|nr:uncharacterized protein LOC108150810 [Drosophila miranda]